MKVITAERLRELYCYDDKTGVFTRLKTSSRRHKTGPLPKAGDSNSYRRLYIDGCRYKQHRLAYLYVHGEWPPGLIDHKNGSPSDNSLQNLRPADLQINAENRTRSNKNNKLGLLGVSTKKREDGSTAYRAQICVKRRVIALGTFESALHAHECYLNAKRQLHAGFSGLVRHIESLE